jgi:type III restriction enzyme
LYFVVESKGTLGVYFLRPSEKVKLDCGIKHFEELSRQSGQDLKMIVARDMEDVVNKVMA